MTVARQRQETECERELVLTNPAGLHARPATTFAKLAKAFESEVLLRKDGLEVNGKSPLDIMTLGAEKGARLTLITRGPDAPEAFHALLELLESDFGET